jgi:hypothetical protein
MKISKAFTTTVSSGLGQFESGHEIGSRGERQLRDADRLFWLVIPREVARLSRPEAYHRDSGIMCDDIVVSF